MENQLNKWKSNGSKRSLGYPSPTIRTLRRSHDSFRILVIWELVSDELVEIGRCFDNQHPLPPCQTPN